MPAPGQSLDAAASSITVKGRDLPGFDPDVVAYDVHPSLSGDVTATARDPYATVSVTQRVHQNSSVETPAFRRGGNGLLRSRAEKALAGRGLAVDRPNQTFTNYSATRLRPGRRPRRR
jgi:hypothetical protein